MGKWKGLPREQKYLCGAHARSTGKPCKRFARKNGRCKLHGGASTGAKEPFVKHGLYTKKHIQVYDCYMSLIENSKPT